MPPPKTPPAIDELELSVFGTGLGECVVVHLGGGEWLVVDSCVDSTAGQPVALGYLSAIGVDPTQSVKLIVVTHWHDDHMRGAARIVESAPTAKFVCSAALQTEQFFKLLSQDQDVSLRTSDTSGVAEFVKILKVFAERGLSENPQWALAATRLYNRARSGSVPDAEVFAVAPSSASVTDGFKAIAALASPAPRSTKRAIVAPGPNETALVLHVRVGQQCAVLGADLETGRGPNRGWLGVISNNACPSSLAGMYKVAHHGSQNADHPSIWTALLRPNPIGVLTPFFRGRVSLPRKTDIDRIKGQGAALYAAASLNAPRPARRNKTVERTIREAARVFRPRAGRMGQVRVRLGGSGPNVTLFDAAVPL